MKRNIQNIYKFSARRIKADKLADVIQAAYGSSVEARKMNDACWAMVISMAGVNPPSTETKELAIELLQAREEASRRVRAQKSYPVAA